MAKRSKRLKSGIESIKKEIEEHFKKIEEDIHSKNYDRGKYHINEVNKSLIKALKYKVKLLGKNNEDKDIEKYEKKLKELEEKLEREEEG